MYAYVCLPIGRDAKVSMHMYIYHVCAMYAFNVYVNMYVCVGMDEYIH